MVGTIKDIWEKNFNISEAARIIYFLLKNPYEGKKKKKIFDQELGLLETCLESVPSTYIITVIWFSAFNGENLDTIFPINLIVFVTAKSSDDSLPSIIFNQDSPTLFTGIFGGIPTDEFFTTYTISIISAALGLAKCLKNGVARPIAPGGTLDGLLTGKFLVAFLASAVVMVTRGFCIAFILV